MFSRCLVALCLTTLPAIVHAQVDFSPRTGLLLLRNGNLLAGEITPAGDYYIVTGNKSSEVRLPKDQVEAVCRDLQDAYTFKLASMHGTGVRTQIEMAEWCLRQRLFDKAESHLAEIAAADAKHPSLAPLARRLKIARKVGEKTTTTTEPSTAVLPTDLDHVEDNLPAGAIEKFTTIVQPLLINRCASGGCHGGQSKSSWQIIRPIAGQQMQKRATQRNLFGALQLIDRERPGQSPLLAVPSAEHGGGKVLFDSASKEQLAILTAWVQQVVDPGVTQPASIKPAITNLASPGGTANAGDPSAAKTPTSPITANVSPPDNAATNPITPPANNTDGPFRPRDPFDPEIFHRRLQGEKKPAEKKAAEKKPK